MVIFIMEIIEYFLVFEEIMYFNVDYIDLF